VAAPVAPEVPPAGSCAIVTPESASAMIAVIADSNIFIFFLFIPLGQRFCCLGKYQVLIAPKFLSVELVARESRALC
jgi:hypothetical protein